MRVFLIFLINFLSSKFELSSKFQRERERERERAEKKQTVFNTLTVDYSTTTGLSSVREREQSFLTIGFDLTVRT